MCAKCHVIDLNCTNILLLNCLHFFISNEILFRATLRIISVQQKRQISCYPAIQKLDKNMLLASSLPPRSMNDKTMRPQFSVMKRSGRYIRTLYGSQVKVSFLNYLKSAFSRSIVIESPLQYLNMITYKPYFQNNNNRIWHNIPTDSTEHDKRFSDLKTSRLIGEIFYILQPLVHLGSLAVFGKRSWKPWLISLGLDVIRSVK